MRYDPLEYIRNYYNVPAYKDVPIEYEGKRGRITGADGPYVMAKLDGEKHARNYHPNDLTYHPKGTD